MKFIIPILALFIIGGCTKTDAPINFNCKINGTAIQGTGVTYYTDPPQFQFTMTGPNQQSVTIIWYNIDSASWIGTHITPKVYNMPTNPLPPFVVLGSYSSQFGATSYNTGTGLGGYVTVTNNTGVGGVMSGTFSFSAININSPYDTVYVTNGTFTNVRVGTS